MVSHNLFPISICQCRSPWPNYIYLNQKYILYIWSVLVIYIFSINVHVWQSVNEQTIFHRPITEYIFLLSISYIRHGICQRYFFIQSTFFFYLLFFHGFGYHYNISYIIRIEHQSWNNKKNIWDRKIGINKSRKYLFLKLYLDWMCFFI